MPLARDSAWFRVPLLGRYFRWLDNETPTGDVEPLPVVHPDGQSSVPGVYVAGDLTGVPLLKLSADGGAEVVAALLHDPAFVRERAARQGSGGAADTYDLVIVGAGVAGSAAAVAAKEAGLRFVVYEADRPLSTIRNFPDGKPIYLYPEDRRQEASFTAAGDTKEELLAHMQRQVEAADLPIRQGVSVLALHGRRGAFRVETDEGEVEALRVLVAVGKAGESRRLDVPGEDRRKVMDRLLDPSKHACDRVLVVGGGDSAVEAALLLAEEEGTEVTLSYRRGKLSRPKPGNAERFAAAVADGRVRAVWNSAVREIRADVVLLDVEGRDEPLAVPNDVVFRLIGRKPPFALFRRMGLAIENAWTRDTWVLFAALLLFSGALYFGKKAWPVGGGVLAVFTRGPAAYVGRPFGDALTGAIAWLSLIGFVVTGAWSLAIVARRLAAWFGSAWKAFETVYFFAVGALVVAVHVAEHYYGAPLLGRGLGFWYTSLYTLTIAIFGVRRILVRRTRYITWQTATLIGVQTLFLFLLPELVLPPLGEAGMLPGWVEQNVFPDGSYWRSYGFILAWPLFVANLMEGDPTTFWLVLSLVQTFVVIPAIVWRWGKGAYCGWICSCGGLAETLGDEYRTKMPHGAGPRALENAGQVVLFAAIVITLWNIFAPGTLAGLLGASQKTYAIVVDIVFAGVLGLGVYFFLSGRVWCRFFCPLAALMHVYHRLGVYRIFADKDRCISCGLCTRVCHMGIDVMNYANKGRPMDDYECVRCSACVWSCPVQCLNFGRVGRDGTWRTTTFGLRLEKPEHLVRGPRPEAGAH